MIWEHVKNNITDMYIIFTDIPDKMILKIGLKVNKYRKRVHLMYEWLLTENKKEG